MSADNWAICHACKKRAQDKWEAERDRVMATYGQVPVDAFDQARAKLAADEPNDDEKFRTFREDYDWWVNPETLTIEGEYRGRCDCGYGGTVNVAQKLDPIDPEASR